jgi:hypothetical protein
MKKSPRKTLAVLTASAALVGGIALSTGASAATGPSAGTSQSTTAAPRCANGHLCIVDGRGKRYDYYKCGTYSFYGIGNGTFNNNQTRGTTARFYSRSGKLLWENRAKDTGTASWTKVWKVRPC